MPSLLIAQSTDATTDMESVPVKSFDEATTLLTFVLMLATEPEEGMPILNEWLERRDKDCNQCDRADCGNVIVTTPFDNGMAMFAYVA